MVIGDDEYKTEVTLPAFAKAELEPRGFAVRVIHADATDKDQFPGLAEAARAADLILVSARRRTPPADQLEALRAHVAAGKPVVGIRTACHAFAPRGKEAVRAGRSVWPEFDPEVIGGHYTGHHGSGPQASLTAAQGAKDHPIMRGVDLTRLLSHGSLYKVAPLVTSTTPLIIGSIAGKEPEPVAWTNVPRVGHSRVFYTSLGHPADFESPAFRKLLLNGICWTIGIAPPGAVEKVETRRASP
jgi:type 1 glutamine amidotransferase